MNQSSTARAMYKLVMSTATREHYLIAELGEDGAKRYAGRLPALAFAAHNPRIGVRGYKIHAEIEQGLFRTRKAANNAARRIETFAAHHAGKTGRPIGTVDVARVQS